MRKIKARRLLSRSKQPSTPPRRAARVRTYPSDNLYAQTSSTIPPLPLPSAASPRHPHTFRFENGSYKYTTGVVSLPLLARRTLGADVAAFKVYSPVAFSKSACENVRNILYATGDQPPTNSLSSLLKRMYEMTAKAYTTADAITGVFFQLFRGRANLRALRLPWTTIEATARQWNLYCQLYRSHTGAPISVPQIRLTIPSFDVLPSIKGTLWNKPGNKIELHINADLRPSVLSGMTQEDLAPPADADADSSSNSCIQNVVDDLLRTMAPIVAPPMPTDPAEIVMKLKTAVTSYLKHSELHALIEFRSLEVILANIKRQRYVSNVLLNIDGSQQGEPAMEQVGQRTAITLSNGSGMDGVALSHSTSEKLGFDKVNAIVNVVPGQLHPKNASDIVQEFDNVCRTLHETGLKSVLTAANLLARSNRDTSGVLNFNFGQHQAANLPPGGSVNIEWNKEPGQARMSVRVPKSSMKARVLGSDTVDFHTPDTTLQYELPEHVNEQTGTSEANGETAMDEVSTIIQACYSICENVADRAVFTSLDEVPVRLAEAVLEVLDFPPLGVTLQKVRVSVRSVDNPSALHRGEASQTARATSPDQSHERHVMTENSTSNSIEPYQRTQSLQVQSSGGLSSELSLEGEHSQLAFKYVKGTGKSCLLTTHLIPCEALRKPTGFESYCVNIARDPSAREPLPEIKVKEVNHIVEDSLAASSRDGIFSLKGLHSVLDELGLTDRHMALVFRTTDMAMLGDGISISGNAPDLRVQCFKDRSDEHTTARGFTSIRIRFPGFQSSVELENQALSTGTRAHFHISVPGSFPNRASNQSTTAAEAVFRVFKDIHRITREVIQRQAYPDLEALVNSLLDTLYINRHILDPIIHPQELKVTAALREGAHNAPAIAKASAIRKVNETATSKQVENIDGNGGFSRLQTLLKSDEDDERDIESQPRETTLSILKPKGESATTDSETVATEGPSVADYEVSAQSEEAETPQDLAEDHVKTDSPWRDAFIALGSNVGDRFKNIEDACREMDADPGIRIVKTSHLYETEPMYVADQGSFLNGAAQIETNLQPLDLLDKLQEIENRLGRVKVVEKGPRSIDLDILFYGRVNMATERLTIPHPLMHEREFVLRPLMDFRSARTWPISRHMSVRKAYRRLSPSIHPLVPLGPDSQYLRALDPQKSTRIMSVLNTTPDSFSDGGDNPASDVEALQAIVRSNIEGGASIIDIGGQSSRPNAPDVTAEEEINRILPAIEAIRSIPEAEHVAISVDTYRALVAEAAINAGANIINDISAGNLDPDMLPTIARLGCTFVMMHMRGTPATMMNPDNCNYDKGLIHTIHEELQRRVHEAQIAGIRRWRIVLDPGIGFSKTAEQNAELLKHFQTLRSRFHGYSWLVGTSRKSFIGKLTGVQDPKQRVWGTAATVTAAVMGGADIVRVHDVKEMADVVKMADAMYRV